jgi:DNA-binding response OmpR family regulator
MRILIADDDRSFCVLLTEVLEDKGHEVDCTDRGLEGYKMSQRNLMTFVFSTFVCRFCWARNS